MGGGCAHARAGAAFVSPVASPLVRGGAQVVSPSGNLVGRCVPQRAACARFARQVVRAADGGPGGADPGSVPINLPSGVLLLMSSIAAIAAIGCVFELTSGNPQYGETVTKAILAVSIPVFVFLYYAAIKKGQLEAELDP